MTVTVITNTESGDTLTTPEATAILIEHEGKRYRVTPAEDGHIVIVSEGRTLSTVGAHAGSTVIAIDAD